MPSRVQVNQSDKYYRAIRTLLQVGLVQGLIQLWNAFAAHPLTPEQVIAITVVATPLISFGQNLIEDTTSVPSLLKSPPSTGQNPQPLPPTS